MAYTINPHMGKVRRDAVRLVKYRGWSMRKVALRYGVNVSTVSRWCKKDVSGGWHLIPTLSSKPKHSPGALKRSIVKKIIEKRVGRRRCGQVIHKELEREGVRVSLSSVQRTLERCGLLKKRSPWKRPHDFTPRPEVGKAGDLVQIDTIHIIAPDGSRIYVYTLIDLHSRWAYAKVVPRIGASISCSFLKEALTKSDFQINLVQTDNGSEFSTGFTHFCERHRVKHRHSRVRKKNDNAHIERFNRTIQEECFDRTTHTLKDFKKALPAYLSYYNEERLHMGINFKTPLEVLQRS